jgi:hypothetical protein
MEDKMRAASDNRWDEAAADVAPSSNSISIGCLSTTSTPMLVT